MAELISIIVPVYNHSETIARCLSSLVAQTYRPLEIIVVDDGSTDDIAGAVKSFFQNANNPDGVQVKLIKQNNSGAPAARNKGFSQSTGQFVIFIDADTIARPTMIEKLYVSLSSSKSSYAYSGFKYGFKVFRSHPFDPDKLKKTNYIDVSALIRREDFPGFDTSLKRFQDWDLWLSMLERGKTGLFVNDILYKKITAGRKGMSKWLPSFVYKLPFKTKAVRNYEASRQIVCQKHGLLP